MAKRWQIIMAGLVLTGLFLNQLARSQADPDLWGYLAFGRLFWSGPGFPYHDVFSYAPTLPLWVYHEWLTGVVFYPLYQYLGPWSLQVLRYGLALGAVGLTWGVARRRGAGPLASGLILLWWCYVLASSYSPLRAGAFTYFCFALYLFVLESHRLDGRAGRLAWLAPIMLVWANAHGGFLAGLGLVGLYFLGGLLARRWSWPLLAAGAGAGLATLINPYGLAYWGYLVEAVRLPRAEIGEWASLWGAWQGGAPGDQVVFFLLALLLCALLAAWHRRWEPTKLLVLLVTAYLGASHLRHQPFFFLAMMALGASDLAALLGRFREAPWAASLGRALGGRWAGGLGLALVGVLLLKWLLAAPWVLAPLGPGQAQGAWHYYPLGAVEYLAKRQARGNLLPQFLWGEYVLWRLGPGIKVGMDGRYETVYPPAYCLAYFDFLRGRPGGERFLAQYPHHYALFPPGSPAVALLERTPGWVKVYQDAGSVLYRRTP